MNRRAEIMIGSLAVLAGMTIVITALFAVGYFLGPGTLDWIGGIAFFGLVILSMISIGMAIDERLRKRRDGIGKDE